MKSHYLSLIIPFILFSCADPFSFIEYDESEEQKIETAISQTNQIRMHDHIAAIEGDRSTDIPSYELSVYEDYLCNYLDTILGLTVTREPVPYGSRSMDNIIAVKHGSDSGLAPVYVIAHWDTVHRSPGADDNGSGCAGILETAECIRDINLTRDVVFIMFAYEEWRMIGSYYHVSRMDRKPVAVLDLEMIGFISDAEVAPALFENFLGFPKYGDFLGIFTDKNSRNLGMNFIRVIDDFVPGLKYYLAAMDDNLENNEELQDIYRSDHAPFWEKGIPALFITDTADFRGDTPYHTSDDTIEHINFDFMELTVKATIGTVLLYAGMEL